MEQGKLSWYDPSTGRHIATFEDEREARIREQEARALAETRIRELEAELRQLRERPE